IHTQTAGCSKPLPLCMVCKNHLTCAYIDKIKKDIIILCPNNNNNCWKTAGIILANVNNVIKIERSDEVCSKFFRTNPY
ncbi:MAG: hypothetical protein Harvfovirus13_25, partial [Harvfovirus sp.]